MSLMLSCESLSKSYGSRLLFQGISFGLDDTERTALIGPNGSGKSTLMKILAGVEQPDAGSLTSRRSIKLGYLPQEDAFTAGASVEQLVIEALEHEHFEEHERETQAAMILGKIGFERFDQQVESLSGGWKKRLALARELVGKPDLLLLDEPTNHLDLEGILWLEKLLRNASFACLLISHDRYFLENVTNRTIELSKEYADGFLSVSGPYSEFLERKSEYLSAQVSQEQSLAGKVRRELEWLKRGAKARTTKAKGRIQEAGRMVSDLAEIKTRNAQSGPITVDFASSHRQTRKLVAVKKLTKALGGRTLFNDLSFVLAPGMKLGLLGPNGSGKTTLIRLLTGELQPDSGEIIRADQIKIVHFDQAREQLDRTMLLGEALAPGSQTVAYRGRSMHISAWARQFLFRTDQLELPVGELSGGEQSRILIARLMLRPADLLILDEPTNDLDISSLDVLEESLADFPGALVLVTHDRFMLDRVSTDLLGLDGNGGAQLFADFAQWERSQEDREREAKEAVAAARKPAPAKPAVAKPSTRRLSWNEQKEWDQIEGDITRAETELERCQKEMEDPKMMADHVKLAESCRKFQAAQEAVDRLFARWQELEAKQT